ncbi:MAG: TIGR03943 family protein [Verrucomicrobiota bacterium]
MSKLFARWLPCATLATWSAILLYFYFSGRINSLLTPAFRPYVLVAGIVLALMAAVFILTPADASCCSAADCGHSLVRLPIGKLFTFAVLLLPITVSATFSPDSFGKKLIENRGIDTDGSTLQPRKTTSFTPPELPLPTKEDTASLQPPPSAESDAGTDSKNASDYLQRTPEGFIMVEVLDLLYAAQDTELRKDFENKKVELVGQLMPDKTVNATGPKRFKAVRMFMTCCAADARPVATLVETDQLPDLPEMTWVKVIGTSTFPLENGRRVAVLKSERIEKASPPDETMLY